MLVSRHVYLTDTMNNRIDWNKGSVSDLLSTEFRICTCTSCQNLLSTPDFHDLIRLSFLYLQLKVESREVDHLSAMRHQPSMCKVRIIEPQYLLLTTRTFLHYLLSTTSILSIVGVHVITLPASNIISRNAL